MKSRMSLVSTVCVGEADPAGAELRRGLSRSAGDEIESILRGLGCICS